MQSYYDKNRRFECHSNYSMLSRSKTTNIKSLNSYVSSHSSPTMRITAYEKRSESPIKLSRTIETNLELKDGRENLIEQEFYNRLLSAHHRVDELLKSRGIKSEEKDTSLEHDHTFTFPRLDNYNIVSRNIRRPSRRQSYDLDLSPKCFSTSIFERPDQHRSATSLFPPTMNEESVHFSICDTTIELKPINIPESLTANITMLTVLVSTLSLSTTAVKKKSDISFTQASARTLKWVKDFAAASLSEAGNVSKSLQDSSIIKKTIILNRTRQLRTVFRQAEVSIQHCSFYKVSKRFENQENCVRLNLRLTERTPMNLNTSTIIIANARTISVREYFVEPISIGTSPTNCRKSLRLKNGIATFNITDQASKDTQSEKKKISRLRIPEQFLNISQDNSNCSQLVGGFIYDCDNLKKKSSRFPLSSAINKRLTHQKKENSLPKKDADKHFTDSTPKSFSLSEKDEPKMLSLSQITVDHTENETCSRNREHPILRKTSQNSRHISKENKIFDAAVRLRKVDHSIIRPRIAFELPAKWIPSWRKQRSCIHD